MYSDKFAKSILILLVAIIVFAGIFGFLVFEKFPTYDHSKSNEITLRNFTPGAQVNYRVLSGKEVIKQEKAQVDNDGELSIPIDEAGFLKNGKKARPVKYELKVAKPEALKEKGVEREIKGEEKEGHHLSRLDEDRKSESADLLNLMISLNPQDKTAGFSVKGLGEFSNIMLKDGNKEAQKLSADWAGMFATNFGETKTLKTINSDMDGKLQLAFMGSNIKSDLLTDAAGMPIVEAQITGFLLGRGHRRKNTAKWSAPFTSMTRQFTLIMAKQTTLIGMFIDANIQLETQRKIQEMHARAHKDYHPSEQMCRVGSYVRSIAHTESKSELNKTVLNRYLIDQYTGVVHSTAAGGSNVYEDIKINSYIKDYCNTSDNGTASSAICSAITPEAKSGEKLERKNKDIDYTRTVETKLTLDIDFTDNTIDPDEEDIFAMARHLYFPTAFYVTKAAANNKNPIPHYDSRSYATKMGVAHNSFINIIGMKTSAPAGLKTSTTKTIPEPAPFGSGSPVESSNKVHKTAGDGIVVDGQCTNGSGGSGCIQTKLIKDRKDVLEMDEDSGWAYMKAMLREFRTVDENGAATALSDAEIDKMLGERPSYYAQMEVLTKKIYQNPGFYINLYDKPANVKRLGAAMDAILLMNQRDRFESLLRQEMLSATMIENGLYEKIEELNSGMFEEMQRPQISNK